MTPIDWDPSSARLRRFGFFATASLAYAAFRVVSLPGLGAATWTRELGGAALAAVAVWSLGCSLVFPRANRPLYVAATLVTLPVSMLMSTLILGVVFFCVVTPIGVLRRMFGADPLGRHLETSRKSYWADSRRSRSREDYFKLF